MSELGVEKMKPKPVDEQLWAELYPKWQVGLKKSAFYERIGGIRGKAHG